MNRYIAAGVVADMRAGKNVLVIVPVRTAIHDYMHQVLDAMGDLREGDFVKWTNGGIRSGVGRIDFTSVRSNFRGYSPDVVVVDCDPYTLDEEWMYDLRHGLAGGPRRTEVILR